jgi:hypothetical protein
VNVVPAPYNVKKVIQNNHGIRVRMFFLSGWWRSLAFSWNVIVSFECIFCCCLRSQYHQSPFRVAAIILSILCFILSFKNWLSRIAGAIVVLIVLLTLVTHLDAWALYVAILGTVVASVGSLVIIIRDDPESSLPNGGLYSIMAMLAFFLWLATGVVVYQIPVDVPVTSAPPPKSPEVETS